MRFDKEQAVFEIGKVKIGGRRGENPAVLVGTIFYAGHKIVQDAKHGIIDKQRAAELIRQQDEMARTTGSPCMLDVVGDTKEAMVKYVDFISETTDTPFFLDGVDAEVRMHALKHIADVGLQERVVYSTISPTTRKEEFDAIREAKIKSAVIFAFSTYDPTPEGKADLLDRVDGGRGLLELAREAGITKPLVDTAVLDISSLSLSCKAIQLVKQRHGIPAGCAPANGMSLWQKARGSKEYYKSCEASAAVFTMSFGADFILYGPIGSAATVFPAVATYEALLAYASKWDTGVAPVKEHPFYKMF